jgi:hypothetical protein
MTRETKARSLVPAPTPGLAAGYRSTPGFAYTDVTDRLFGFSQRQRSIVAAAFTGKRMVTAAVLAPAIAGTRAILE